MNNEKKDYSEHCNLNDEDMNNPCLQCKNFVFPIGCMIADLVKAMEEDFASIEQPLSN